MRAFLSLLAVFALACASAQADLVVNDLVDAVLKRLSNNEKITSLPDLEEDASVKVLFWNTPVKIEADDGAPVGGVTLKRFGNATLEIDEVGNLALLLEVGIDEAELTYEYKTEVASVKGPGGRFTATVGATSVQGKIAFIFTDYTCDVMPVDVKVAKLGDITVEKGGSNDVVNTVYRKFLVDMLATKRQSVLQKAIDAANASFGYDCSKILPSILAASKPAGKAASATSA
ncbi:uncharacterized protein LOC117641573 [Thrips palmi]|uniref:Uncharacterized protein LOC117641573 n=1 Tax=Thrips palmi TaxID=161013 RepID=A0A6P8YEQ2_THRPL|nr:uncharacterized protein LOC117641573 [Thrips palmi]